MVATIKEISTITAKGQTTVPKAVRQALGVDCGGKIAFRVEGRRVTLSNAVAEHRDPTLEAFLEVIRKDLAKGRSVKTLPADFASAMRCVLNEVPVSLDEPLDGDVIL
jgi:antitoxin PrlF